MPQLIMEYSPNVQETAVIPRLFQECHQLLAKVISTEVASCKSRAVMRDVYAVGDGNPNNAFIHVNLKIMPGRDQDTQQALGKQLMTLFETYFKDSFAQLNLQITLEIEELQKTYFKVASKRA